MKPDERFKGRECRSNNAQSEELQLRVDPIHGDVNDTISDLHHKVLGLKNVAQGIESEAKFQNDFLSQLDVRSPHGNSRTKDSAVVGNNGNFAVGEVAAGKCVDATNGQEIRCDPPLISNPKSNTPFYFSAASIPSSINASASKSIDNSTNNMPKPSSNPGNKPRSFLEAVANSSPAIASGARFAIPAQDEISTIGKHFRDPSTFHVTPNPEMLNEIIKEKDRLRNSAIFFSAVEIDKVPARKFLDDWFHNYWNLKLGYHISFCRQIQKGLFVVFFINNESQQAVLKKEYWTVGNTTFRALAWNAEANLDEVVALSAPRWILLKKIPIPVISPTRFCFIVCSLIFLVLKYNFSRCCFLCVSSHFTILLYISRFINCTFLDSSSDVTLKFCILDLHSQIPNLLEFSSHLPSNSSKDW